MRLAIKKHDEQIKQMKAHHSFRKRRAGSLVEPTVHPLPMLTVSKPEEDKSDMQLIEFGLSISVTGLEQFKPPFTTPFDNIIKNEHRNYLDNYE